MGLLDIFDTYEGQQGLGLLAAAGPRADGAGFGQRLAEGLGQAQAWKKQKELQAYQRQMMELQALQIKEAKAKAAQEEQLRALIPKFATPGQSGTAPGFDFNGYAKAMAGIDPARAMALQQSLQKESTINKLDVKDFTPASVAKYALTKDYADLVRLDKAHFANTGGATVALDPYTGKTLGTVANTQSPDNAASVSATLRGQKLTNALGWANHQLGQNRLTFDQTQAGKPQYHEGQWVTPPSAMAAGQAVSAMATSGQKDAREALNLIETARQIIPKSTGSWLGAGVDQVGRVFGASTGGDTAAAQLKALEGALVSKMPKMTGPQSDKDVLLYKQMAGEIGDPTIPKSRKLAALQVIEEIQKRHAGTPATAPVTATPQVPAPGVPGLRWNPKTGTLDMVN